MRKALVFIGLVTVLVLTMTLGGSRTASATDTCESMHLKRCTWPGLQSPCTYADGSPGLCTCAGNRWDCGF
jgi:hypothetical protein